MAVTHKHAAALVVMVAAGGDTDTVLDLALLYGVRPVHLDQLAVPAEQETARQRLLQDLKDQWCLHTST